MAESKLYTARVQVVEAMEQGLPWHEAAKLGLSLFLLALVLSLMSTLWSVYFVA